jgi:hypothetical protein
MRWLRSTGWLFGLAAIQVALNPSGSWTVSGRPAVQLARVRIEEFSDGS